MTLVLASVDTHWLPVRAGAWHEREEIAVVCCGIDEAIGLAAKEVVHSAPRMIALQWLKLNRDTIPALLHSGPW